jgi:hypothetical protein
MMSLLAPLRHHGVVRLSLTPLQTFSASGCPQLLLLSLKCDDRADITIIVPDDKNEPVMALLDTERRNKVDAIVLDERRLGKWEETFPLRGLHPDDKLLPTSMEPRCHPPSKPLKNFTCT